MTVVSVDQRDVAMIVEAVALQKTVRLKLPQDNIEVRCNSVPIARLSWEGDDFRIVALACYGGAHGTMDSKWSGITERLKTLGCVQMPQNCTLCNGTQWIPLKNQSAKTGAILSGSLGCFRGVTFAPSQELKQFSEKVAPFSIASLLR